MQAMIALIIKCYLTIFLSVGIGSLFIFLVGLYYIFKPQTKRMKPAAVIVESSSVDTIQQEAMTQAQHAEEAAKSYESLANLTKPMQMASDDDFTAIAGDNVIATQLDLARAYLETGNNQLAKEILQMVMLKGNYSQQIEAKHLINIL